MAEDNAVNQMVATQMLEKHGCRADVAANGLEAAHAVSRLPYHLVLMDCQMPETVPRRSSATNPSGST